MNIKHIEAKLNRIDELDTRQIYAVLKALHENIEHKYLETFESFQIDSLYAGKDILEISGDDPVEVSKWVKSEVKKASEELEHYKGLFIPYKEWYDSEVMFITSKSVKYSDGIFN